MTGQINGRRHHMEPGTAPLPYVKGGKRSLIFGSVSIFHAGLILIPFLLYSLSNFINPPVSVTKVSLVDSPPNDNERPSKYPDAARPDPIGIPNYGDPGPITDIPDVPDPIVEPEPEPAVKPEPKVETAPPEPEVKPVVKTPKTEVRVPKELVKSKESKVKPKPKWKSPDEIRKSTKIIRKGPIRTSGRRSSDTRKQDIRNILKNWAATGGTGSGSPNSSRYGMRGGRGLAGGGGGPVGVLDKDLIDYYNKVAAYLKRNWNQPNKAALNNSMPKVELRLRIDNAGKVLSATIIRRSGNRAMDASVEELVQDLKVLPNPPKAMEFVVTMEIDPW